VHSAYCGGVKKIELSYSLTARDADRPSIRNPLMEVLHAVRQHGSIAAAAKALGQSYRHVWGELKRWETELGRNLIVWDKGQPARLSEFGDKLLWAEQQAQARLAPQIEALHADLERAFAMAFDDSAHVLTLYASHDDALVALREHAAARAGLHLDIRFTGSVDAIGALNEGRCVLAGFHTLQQAAPTDPPSLAQRTYQPLLQPGRHKIIGFARRTQGLVVARGNPLRLATLADLEPRRARYVNRALGTAGTGAGGPSAHRRLGAHRALACGGGAGDRVRRRRRRPGDRGGGPGPRSGLLAAGAGSVLPGLPAIGAGAAADAGAARSAGRRPVAGAAGAVAGLRGLSQRRGAEPQAAVAVVALRAPQEAPALAGCAAQRYRAGLPTRIGCMPASKSSITCGGTGLTRWASNPAASARSRSCALP
jgi:molybdate transport repressor ModE-like protein